MKGGKDDVADFADWRWQAGTIGWEAPRTFLTYGSRLPELPEEQRLRPAYDVALPILAERLEHRAVVKLWHLRVAAARGLVDAGIAAIADARAKRQPSQAGVVMP